MGKVTKQELLNSLDKLKETGKNSSKISDKEGFENFVNRLKRSANELDYKNPNISSYLGFIDCMTNAYKDGKRN